MKKKKKKKEKPKRETGKNEERKRKSEVGPSGPHDAPQGCSGPTNQRRDKGSPHHENPASLSCLVY